MSHLPDRIPDRRTGASALLFDHGASAVCVYDPQDRILDWNERYLAFFPEVRPLIRVGLPFVDTVRLFLQLQHPHMSALELDANIDSALRRHRAEKGPLRYQRADSGRWLELQMFTQPDGGLIKIWSDVSSEHAVESDSDQLLKLMAVANLGLIVHDRKGQLKFVNSRFFSDKFLRVITSMPTIQTREHAGSYWSKFQEIFQGDENYAQLLRESYAGPLREAVTLRARTGHYYQIEEQAWDDGIASLWTEVTTLLERKRALQLANEELAVLNARLRKAVETDSLTGLPNRRRFDVALQEAQARLSHDQVNEDDASAPESGTGPRAATIAASPCAVGILDLDHFKAINDRMGHDAGDAVLVEVACRLRNALQPHDLIARLGGEEFGLLFLGATLAVAHARAEQLRSSLCTTPFRFEEVEFFVTASIGIATLAKDAAASASLRRADLALFEAKSKGRNRVAQTGGSLLDGDQHAH